MSECKECELHVKQNRYLIEEIQKWFPQYKMLEAWMCDKHPETMRHLVKNLGFKIRAHYNVHGGEEDE